MVALVTLWLPIVVSAVVVFFISYIMWMVMPHHKPDFRKIPDEDGVLEAISKQKMAPGQYMFPYCSDAKQMSEPLYVKKYESGPVGSLTLKRPGKPAMGKLLVCSILYNLAMAIFAAYLAGRTLAAGAEYLAVFRVAGTATFLAYTGALFYPAIWMGRPWRAVWMDTLDGLVYALMTGGIFGWLWPR